MGDVRAAFVCELPVAEVEVNWKVLRSLDTELERSVKSYKPLLPV